MRDLDYEKSWAPKNWCFWTVANSSIIFSPDLQSVSSVAQSSLTLGNPMDCNTPGLPVHHHLPEFTQIHVHRVSDAIQRSHPLTSPSPPTFNLSQHQGFVQWSKISRQEWKGREPSGVGRMVTGLRTSQGNIVRPEFSINTTWYLKILWFSSVQFGSMCPVSVSSCNTEYFTVVKKKFLLACTTIIYTYYAKF